MQPTGTKPSTSRLDAPSAPANLKQTHDEQMRKIYTVYCKTKSITSYVAAGSGKRPLRSSVSLEMMLYWLMTCMEKNRIVILDSPTHITPSTRFIVSGDKSIFRLR